MINSKKGEEIFEGVKLNIDFIKVGIESIIKHNSPLCNSVPYNKDREQFFECLDNDNFNEIVNKFLNNK